MSFVLLSIVSHITLIIPSNSISGILSNGGPLPSTTKILHLTHLLSHSMFNWLYVLNMIDLFIIAFNSAIVDLGNSILKIQNGIKFLLLPLSILYAIFTLFWLVLDSSLVNITDFMPWNIKDFILTESKLLLLSSWLCTVTSFSLCLPCMHLGCWSYSISYPGALKCFCVPHGLHVYQNARHYLWPCAAPQYLQLSILSFFTILWAASHYLTQFCCNYVCDWSLSHFLFGLMLSSMLSTAWLFVPTLAPVHCLFH